MIEMHEARIKGHPIGTLVADFTAVKNIRSIWLKYGLQKLQEKICKKSNNCKSVTRHTLTELKIKKMMKNLKKSLVKKKGNGRGTGKWSTLTGCDMMFVFHYNKKEAA